MPSQHKAPGFPRALARVKQVTPPLECYCRLLILDAWCIDITPAQAALDLAYLLLA